MISHLRSLFFGMIALIIAIAVLGRYIIPRSIGSATPSLFAFGPAISSKQNIINESSLGNLNNATLGFEKIFAINLPSRTDRRDALTLAAAQSNMTITWIEPPDGNTIVPKALPGARSSASYDTEMGIGGLSSWRAHTNSLRKVVEDGLASALILEDDIDWDIRLRSQLAAFALASSALPQPPLDTSNPDADATYARLRASEMTDQPSAMLFADALPATKSRFTSSYGDAWDVLWLGHCGTRSPVLSVPEGWEEVANTLPKGHVIDLHDESVPEPHYIHTWNDEQLRPFRTYYDDVNHTRIYHTPMESVCSSAYAVSQKGARKLLWYVGVRGLDAAFDIMLSEFCAGKASDQLSDRPTCITSQPAIMHQFSRRREESDIADSLPTPGDQSGNDIRVSVRGNLPQLLSGSSDLTDKCPDTHVVD